MQSTRSFSPMANGWGETPIGGTKAFGHNLPNAARGAIIPTMSVVPCDAVGVSSGLPYWAGAFWGRVFYSIDPRRAMPAPMTACQHRFPQWQLLEFVTPLSPASRTDAGLASARESAADEVGAETNEPGLSERRSRVRWRAGTGVSQDCPRQRCRNRYGSKGALWT
jgi:hypothetical protein